MDDSSLMSPTFVARWFVIRKEEPLDGCFPLACVEDVEAEHDEGREEEGDGDGQAHVNADEEGLPGVDEGGKEGEDPSQVNWG